MVTIITEKVQALEQMCPNPVLGCHAPAGFSVPPDRQTSTGIPLSSVKVICAWSDIKPGWIAANEDRIWIPLNKSILLLNNNIFKSQRKNFICADMAPKVAKSLLRQKADRKKKKKKVLNEHKLALLHYLGGGCGDITTEEFVFSQTVQIKVVLGKKKKSISISQQQPLLLIGMRGRTTESGKRIQNEKLVQEEPRSA